MPKYGLDKSGNQVITGYGTVTVKGSGTPNVADQGQDFRTVLEGLIQQGVNPAVALPMLRTLYTDPFIAHAPKYVTQTIKGKKQTGISHQWLADQSYLKFNDPHYGHHPYEGEHGQTFVP